MRRDELRGWQGVDFDGNAENRREVASANSQSNSAKREFAREKLHKDEKSDAQLKEEVDSTSEYKREMRESQPQQGRT